jgi:Fe-S-cluster containining protein
LTPMCQDQPRPREESEFDCQTCGACCGVPAQFAQERVKRRDLRSNTGYVEWVDGMCTALEGKMGEACSCAVYEDRPQGCRELQPGSVWCHVARKAWDVV